MARPRVFVSSTFYDLKHIRASLEVFIESLGFDAVLFEKGDISFHPDVPLDDSCYREAANADIFVLIVGGRYGSVTSNPPLSSADPSEIYQSITRKEFETAQLKDVPTFILVDSAVSAEYQTYLCNKDNKDIVYAHVDSIGVFCLLDAIFKRKRNNPVFNFDRATQIEFWLREQWAGLFRELLQSRSQQRQLSALNAQVAELKSINDTLKTYLETVLSKVNPDNSNQIIRNEEDKLKKIRDEIILKKNDLFNFLNNSKIMSEEQSISLIKDPKNAKEAVDLFDHIIKKNNNSREIDWVLKKSQAAQLDYNDARTLIGMEPVDFSELLHTSHPRIIRRTLKRNILREEGEREESE